MENSLNWLRGTARRRIGATVAGQAYAPPTRLSPPFSDPAFVGSAYIRESLPRGDPAGDDDKIYFFFSEAGKELDVFGNTVVSRIARVCRVSL